MRFRFLKSLMIVSIISFSSSAWAVGPATKFQRGVVNVVTAPLEIPRQARAYWIQGAQKTPHIIVWILSGMVKGVAESVKRFGCGMWDVMTFPWAVPADYSTLVKPEYVFQDWPVNPKSGR